MPNQPTIFITIFIVLLSVVSMFIFPNTIYYSLNLLFIVFLTLSFLFFSGSISSLTVLMLLIVYVGAMMILIGYVCAVCPNINFSTTPNLFPLLLFLSLFICSLIPSFYFTSPSSLTFNLSFFFAYSGFVAFFVLVFMLFVILLVVTSYYVSPKGPFRSVT